MTKFTYTVTVETDTQDHADMIMNERIFFEERYYVTPQDEPVSRDDAGVDDIELDYTITYADEPDDSAICTRCEHWSDEHTPDCEACALNDPTLAPHTFNQAP